MNQTFLDYYRCPERFAGFTPSGVSSGRPGFFRFGADTLCYGSSCSDAAGRPIHQASYDAAGDIAIDVGSVRLSFDPTEVVENLRRERYVDTLHNGDGRARPEPHTPLWKAYHLLRPALPVGIRKHLQRAYLRDWTRLPFPTWPVDTTVDRILERLLRLALQCHGRIPFIWFWPDGAPSGAMLTHDVETVAGRDFCSTLMDLDDSVGIKSSFQIVPEHRYPVHARFLESISERGFEINVHDINHDGQLFTDRALFLERAERINAYAKKFQAAGFRSGTLYRNQDWFDALDFSYDMSVPNLGHLDPQRGGCCTVMPFFIGNILELPLTTTQDYSLFHILKTYSMDLWKRQIGLVTERHGLLSFIIHPDYVIERRARTTYAALLAHLARLRDDGRLWMALPRDIDRWWRLRSQMTVVGDGDSWRIAGHGKERARLAFASLVDGQLTFSFA